MKNKKKKKRKKKRKKNQWNKYTPQKNTNCRRKPRGSVKLDLRQTQFLHHSMTFLYISNLNWTRLRAKLNTQLQIQEVSTFTLVYPSKIDSHSTWLDLLYQ